MRRRLPRAHQVRHFDRVHENVLHIAIEIAERLLHKIHIRLVEPAVSASIQQDARLVPDEALAGGPYTVKHADERLIRDFR